MALHEHNIIYNSKFLSDVDTKDSEMIEILKMSLISCMAHDPLSSLVRSHACTPLHI